MGGGDALAQQVALGQLQQLFSGLLVVGLQGCREGDCCLVQQSGGFTVLHHNDTAVGGESARINTELIHCGLIQQHRMAVGVFQNDRV